MIKAIFFDIDGTILSTKSHTVLPGTVKAFDVLHKKGIRTFISSGRPMVLIPQMPVTFDGYITVNGGYCFAGDDVVLRKPIHPDDCRRWLQYVEENDMTTMCFTDKEMFINRIDEPTLRLHDELGFQMPPMLPLDTMKGREVYQFIAMQPASKDAEVLSRLSHSRMPRWHPAFSDLIPADSSKAVGIECLLNHFGISREETMAFGDGANDIEMLEYVATGIAMGNASDLVKSHADYITDTSDNEGIAKALSHLAII